MSASGVSVIARHVIALALALASRRVIVTQSHAVTEAQSQVDSVLGTRTGDDAAIVVESRRA